ncbi:MAG: hypothetical protein WCP21_04155 [Armatimonadota bacterium]
MADVNAGRKVARGYAIWGLLNLVAGGPALGLLAAYDATSDGGLSIKYPIFGTHSWLVMMGWCVPLTFAIVFWLLPILKDTPVRYGSVYTLCLSALIAPTFGLAAYLALAHLGRPAIFVLAPSWACYLAAAILYTVIVWRVCARTLRPTASDIGLSSGAVWLLAILALKLVIALGAAATSRDDFAAQSERALLIAMMLGFVVNTGLALAAAIGPEFLAMGHARPTVVTAFRLYNTCVALWCGGATYLLPYPFGLGRFALTLVSIALLYSITRLLIELRMFEMLLLRANSARRKLTRTALGTAAVMLVLAGGVIMALTLWMAATVTWAPDELVTLTMHLICVGFFPCIIMGLFVPLLGNRSLNGVKLPLAYAAYAFLLAWLLGRTAVAVVVLMNGQPMWFERYVLGLLAGAGAVCLALWMLLALLSPNRPAPLSPPPPAA